MQIDLPGAFSFSAPRPTHAAHHDDDKTVFGFWIYLMSDCVLFAGLFATYAVLCANTAAGPAGRDVFELDYVLVETFFLLFSSVTYGFAILALRLNWRKWLLAWLGLTFLLGLGFVIMEVCEFQHLIAIGYGPDRSAFLSSFFTLVGTHGLHVSCGLIWMAVMIGQILKRGSGGSVPRRLMCLSLFWHFLDIVWICLFSEVYLMGVV